MAALKRYLWPRRRQRPGDDALPVPGPPGAAVLSSAEFAAAVQAALDQGERPALLLIDLHAVDGLPARHDTRRAALDIAVEARLSRAIRPGDSVGRVEDDRYVALARESHGADPIAERLAERLGEPFEIGGEELCVEPRIAVVAAGSERTAHELIERALAGR